MIERGVGETASVQTVAEVVDMDVSTTIAIQSRAETMVQGKKSNTIIQTNMVMEAPTSISSLGIIKLNVSPAIDTPRQEKACKDEISLMLDTNST